MGKTSCSTVGFIHVYSITLTAGENHRDVDITLEKDESCLESQLVKDTSPNTCSLLFLFFLPASCHIHQACGTALSFPTVMGIAGQAGFHALRWDLREPPKLSAKHRYLKRPLIILFSCKSKHQKKTHLGMEYYGNGDTSICDLDLPTSSFV